MSQFSFDFFSEKQSEFEKEDFLLLPENSDVASYLKRMLAQQDYAFATLPSLIIKGERCSGKTHLLHAFAPENNSEFLTEEKISGINLLNFLQPNHFYFFENIEEIKDEELLLNLINSAAEAKAFLIITTKQQPNFQLKDLMSRLRNIAIGEIKNLSEESLKQLLLNQLSRKQINLTGTEINRICRGIERSYAAISDAIKLAEFNQKETTR